MSKRWIGLATAAAAFALALGHDMWLEADEFFLEPGAAVTIRNGNGTIYQKSENAVSVDRIGELFAIGPDGGRFKPNAPRPRGAWTEFEFTPEVAGNYWVLLSTTPRLIRLSADDFRQYLEHDGVPNILRERQEKGISDRDEVERYSKYVKAYFQVGDARSDNYDAPAGLRIEIVPLANPYGLKVGEELPIRVHHEGKPLAGLTVHAGTDRQAAALATAETDAQGQARIPISEAGKWYIRGIHLVQVDREDHSYESAWCTLTFEVR